MAGHKIRLSKCSMSSEEVEASARVISTEYLGMGEEVALFEQEIKNFLRTDSHVVCVNTGTSALQLALSALGVGEGDEVLVPTITYVASFQAISALGAKPIPCDVELTTGFLAVDDARARITSATKAIMPVHYASASGNMEGIYRLAKDYGLRVVEDAAQAFGCSREGQLVGQLGDLICFSFDGIKNITCGEGGAIVTSDSALAEIMRDARLLGVHKDTEMRVSGKRSWNFDVTRQGYRFHLSNVYAAIGRVQLRRFGLFKDKRRQLAKEYIQGLKKVHQVSFLDFDYVSIVPHIFVVLVDDRDGLKVFLQRLGIETGVHYKPNHLLSFYKTNYALPDAESFYSRVISLPLHVDLSMDEQKNIIDYVVKYYES